ncbi:MAG: hypothetical protein LH679_20440 [Cyanobacteria bacterium CAN_BIN43]|nr:hypothetical protein [Cyanobacteria bacterium CAN_BIN43]
MTKNLLSFAKLLKGLHQAIALSSATFQLLGVLGPGIAGAIAASLRVAFMQSPPKNQPLPSSAH